MLVLGTDQFLVALVDLTLRLGMTRLSVLVAPESGPVLWTAEAVREALSGADVVLHISDTPAVELAALVSRAAPPRVPVLHGLVVEDVAWVGPCGAANPPPCWECGWLRLRGGVSVNGSPLAPGGYRGPRGSWQPRPGGVADDRARPSGRGSGSVHQN